jgi:hypothetical protein
VCTEISTYEFYDHFSFYCINDNLSDGLDLPPRRLQTLLNKVCFIPHYGIEESISPMMLLQWQSCTLMGSAEQPSMKTSFQWCNFPPKQRGKGIAMITTEDIEDALDGLFYLNQLLWQNPRYSIL